MKIIGSSSRSVSYLEGLDGLRALAVLAVLFFHANESWLPGGFLGVEVFFVLSGFLITRGLLAEWRSTSSIDLKAFWRRRALRLLPALFLLLAAIVVVSSLIDPDNLARLRGETLAALGYVTNWFLIFDNHSYFATWDRPSLLGHLWSLAIEEQFYLLWPVVLLFGLRFLRAPYLVGLIVLATSASYLAMAFLAGSGGPGEASRAYYGTDTRIGALLLGSAFAFLPLGQGVPAGPQLSKVLPILGPLSLLGLIGLVYVLGQDHPLLYSGGFLLTSLVTGLLIVSLTDPSSAVTRFLALPPLRWLGARSYGVYLWHWPLFLLLWPQTLNPAQFTVLVGLSVVAAALSYSLLEMPVRRGAIGRIWDGFENSSLTGLRGLTGGVALGLIVAVATAIWTLTAARPAEEEPAYFAQTSVRLTSASDSLLISEIAASETAWLPASSPALLIEAPTAACVGSGENQTWLAGGCDIAEAATSEAELALAWRPSQNPPADRFEPNRQIGSVTAVGDSVMLGAAYALVDKIPDLTLDAEVSRSPVAAISLLHQLEASGGLESTIIIHIGTNGLFSRSQFEEIMAIAGPERHVFFLNLEVPRPWEEPNNTMLAAATAEHANAFMIDWQAASIDRPDIFWHDEIHLMREGAVFYAELVAGAIHGGASVP